MNAGEDLSAPVEHVCGVCMVLFNSLDALKSHESVHGDSNDPIIIDDQMPSTSDTSSKRSGKPRVRSRSVKPKKSRSSLEQLRAKMAASGAVPLRKATRPSKVYIHAYG
jgi:hypothetical protein